VPKDSPKVGQLPKLATIPRIIPATVRYSPEVLSLIEELLVEYHKGEILGLCIIKKHQGDVISGWDWHNTAELYWALHSAANELINPGYEE
jgi:hypothetical protein